jgi:peptidoglycan hydrolase CwlO-like protein
VDASTRVALAGVFVSLLIGVATWWLQRRAANTARDLGLIDQIQEERTHFQQRARESDSDLDSCRLKLNDAYEKIDLLIESGQLKDQKLAAKERKIADLQSRLDERPAP